MYQVKLNGLKVRETPSLELIREYAYGLATQAASKYVSKSHKEKAIRQANLLRKGEIGVAFISDYRIDVEEKK